MTDKPSSSDAVMAPMPPPQGARREAMLNDLLVTMRRTHRVRRMRRRVVATGAGSTIIAALLLLVWGSPPEGPRLAEAPPADTSLIPATIPAMPATPSGAERVGRGYAIRIIRENVSLDAYRAAPVPRVERIDDQALLETLAAIHRPAGLIRFGDRVALSAPVTDEELSR